MRHDISGRWVLRKDAEAEVARLTAERDEALKVSEHRQRNSAETWEAMQTMRNAINEHVHMPSMESDLLQGPENSVFCASVAEAVITGIQARAAAAAMEMRERAAMCIDEAATEHCYLDVGLSLSVGANQIRALPIDSDAQKALNQMLAKAREDAIREAANIVNKNRDISGWVSHDAILSLLNDGGRNE